MGMELGNAVLDAECSFAVHVIWKEKMNPDVSVAGPPKYKIQIADSEATQKRIVGLMRRCCPNIDQSWEDGHAEAVGSSFCCNDETVAVKESWIELLLQAASEMDLEFDSTPAENKEYATRIVNEFVKGLVLTS